jgi:ABC-2 type transport system permease protein
MGAYFLSPVAYVVIFLFVLSNGAMFFFYVTQFVGHPRQVQLVLESLFGFALFWLLPLSPLLTMRLIAEEKRSGTLEVLMTAPVTEVQVVAGKFLAAQCFYALIWLSLLPLVAILGICAIGRPDWGPVLAMYIGIFSLGLLTNSLGILASSATRNQLVAAVLALSGNLFFFLLSLGRFLLPEDLGVRRIFNYLSFTIHFDADYRAGVVDVRYLLFYLTFTLLFLTFSVWLVEARKWR